MLHTRRQAGATGTVTVTATVLNNVPTATGSTAVVLDLR